MTEELRHPREYRWPDGDELRRLREACGLSRGEVAERTGYEAETIRIYEGANSTQPGRNFCETVLQVYRSEWPDE